MKDIQGKTHQKRSTKPSSVKHDGAFGATLAHGASTLTSGVVRSTSEANAWHFAEEKVLLSLLSVEIQYT